MCIQILDGGVELTEPEALGCVIESALGMSAAVFDAAVGKLAAC